MTGKITVYNNGQEIVRAFTPFYQEAAVAKIREAEDSWFALLQSASVDPAPLSVDQFRAVTPYAAPQRVDQIINSAVEGGFLAGAAEGGFRLTAAGRSALSAFFDTAHEYIANAPVLPSPDMEMLAGLLQRLVEPINALTDPAEKPNLARSRWTDPGPAAPATVRIDQYLTDLALFRDDAHIAAWQKQDVDGRSWEALTLLWRDEAHTAAELLEKLPRRGYTAEDYAASLDYLAERGWISQSDDNWELTDLGRSVRQEAEDQTDHLFFASWDALSEAELTDLDDLQQRLLNVLKEAASVAEPA